MTVQNTIRRFIDGRGISVYRFRQETGIAHKTAYDLCKKPHQIPGPRVLDKICAAYRIQPGDLMEWVPLSDK